MNTSVVVPTFNETDNVVNLLSRLTANLSSQDEIIFVDDGSDNLPDVVASERPLYPQQIITVLRREQPHGGLGGAVLHGVAHARGDVIVVCDGDLQHPPETIPAMVAHAANADVVVASRYLEGGRSEGLANNYRQTVSELTGSLSKALFPRRLRGCTDPMSGFFAVRRELLAINELRPNGFKILLEILLRLGPVNLTEVSYTFAAREAGESHASLREGFRFLTQLFRARMINRATAFMLVGLSGVLPNLGLLYLLTHFGVGYIMASIIATQVAIVWNFVGAELLVWRDHRVGQWEHRFAKFLIVGESDLLRIPFVILLVELTGMHSVVASAITMVAAFFLRFTLADKIVYRRRSTTVVEPKPELTEIAL